MPAFEYISSTNNSIIRNNSKNIAWSFGPKEANQRGVEKEGLAGGESLLLLKNARSVKN